MRAVPDLLEADARIEDYLRLADKAMEGGKFEKATAYTLLTLAWQTERARAEARCVLNDRGEVVAYKRQAFQP